METTTENNQLVQIVKDSGLAQSKAQVLLEQFTDYFQIAADWEQKANELVITDASQLTEMKQAREGRLFLREKRTAIEKTRKALKEDSLREGQTIDAIAKILTNLITPIEKNLEEKEKFAERMEAERKEELRHIRRESLIRYTGDPDIYPLADMSETAFADLREGLRLAHEAKIEEARRIEAERLERERLDRIEAKRKFDLAPYAMFMNNTFDYRLMSDADFDKLLTELKDAAAAYQAEQVRVREENERLKKEREELERLEIEYRKKVEAEKQAAEAKAAAERREIEEKARIEREAAEAENKRLAAELKEREEAEAAAKATQDALIEQEARKGDADKFTDIIVGLTALKTKHVYKSKKYQKLQSNVNSLIDKIIEYATR